MSELIDDNVMEFHGAKALASVLHKLSSLSVLDIGSLFIDTYARRELRYWSGRRSSSGPTAGKTAALAKT